MTITIIELRNYLLKPGALEHFIDYYETVLVDLQEAFRMTILGQFRLIGEPDRFVFMRGFESMQARLESEHCFYEGPVWAKYGPVPNDMILEYHNVHLLRPLGGIDVLTCGRTMQDVAAGLAAGTISGQADVVAVDMIRATAGKRDELVERFQAVIVPEYQSQAIQARGLFVAEMGKNEFTRHPAVQDAGELVVFTAYESLDACQEKRGRVLPLIGEVMGDLLRDKPESLLLTPTLRSAIRYMP